MPEVMYECEMHNGVGGCPSGGAQGSLSGPKWARVFDHPEEK